MVTVEKARDMLVTRVDYLGDLVQGVGPLGGAPQWGTFLDFQQTMSNVETVVKSITASIDPLSWKERGGPGTVTLHYPSMSIIVRASAEVHASLGAKIGRHAVIWSAPVPVCTDLLTVGQDAILRKDSLVLGYKARANYIHTGRIDIGDGAFVGEATVLDINTSIGKGSQLGHSSCLHSGQRIPDGKRFHGSPAQEAAADYCGIVPMNCSSLRRGGYAAAQLLTLCLLLPLPILLLQQAAPVVLEYLQGAVAVDAMMHEALPELTLRTLKVSGAVFLGSIVIGLHTSPSAGFGWRARPSTPVGLCANRIRMRGWTSRWCGPIAGSLGRSRAATRPSGPWRSLPGRPRSVS